MDNGLIEVFMMPLLFWADSSQTLLDFGYAEQKFFCYATPVNFRCLSGHFRSDFSVQRTFPTDFQQTNSKPAASPLEMTSKYQQNSSGNSQQKSNGLHTVVIIIIIII